MTLFPQGADWARARDAAGLETNSHEDMHAGELETSILLHVTPSVVQPGNETADHIAGDRTHMLSLGLAKYTSTGVVGRPSLGTADKGARAITNFVDGFASYYGVLTR
ncbi:hypothetical protein CS0771_28390 [Catellatospora sp. IY07-71]|uniref:creatininase family protein n=1 Tax=Catellatospora sp. IY07-71 TaxID=2728827 RepID=UPI001BB41426|nr:creatininase family protein [Catellatospora sp. IY07-71]BCJ73295.1 hypothetical protein CS0771_28390 [Catellatospora sp. IY07-71]